MVDGRNPASVEIYYNRCRISINSMMFHKWFCLQIDLLGRLGFREIIRWQCNFVDAFVSVDSGMYPYQRTPMGNPYMSQLSLDCLATIRKNKLQIMTSATDFRLFALLRRNQRNSGHHRPGHRSGHLFAEVVKIP